MQKSHRIRHRRKRQTLRQRQAAAIPQWVSVEFQPEVTRSRHTIAAGSKVKLPKAMPLSEVVPNIRELILKTALVAAHYDLDIFRDGHITFKVKTYRKTLHGDSHPQRVIRLFIWRGMPESELVDTIAHELRHIGQYARGQYSSRHHPGTKGYKSDPVEIDAEGFAQKVAAEVLA